MKVIDVKWELGIDVVTREHGRKLRNLVEGALADAEPPVIVDFDGLRISSVSFFDEAFGQLALRCGTADPFEKIELRRLDKFDSALVHDIINSRLREAGKALSGNEPLSSGQDPHAKTNIGEERLLGHSKAARRMCVTAGWPQRPARGLPFAVKVGKRIALQ